MSAATAREIVAYTTEAAWLAARTADVTSTESAALFGLSPYLTAYELWHRKKTGEVPAFEPSERMRWGNHLEAAIAAGIAEQQGWTVRPMKEYIRLPGERLGASFDYVITDHPSGEPAHLEVKNVDFMAMRRDWLLHEDGTLEAPAHIEMQVQHQMLVSGFHRAYIGALVGGSRGVIIERERDEAVIAAIRAKVASFWRTVDIGDAPPPVFPADAQAIIDAMSDVERDKSLDLTTDHELAVLCAEYRQASERMRLAEEDRKVAQAKLLTHIGSAERVLADGYKVSSALIADQRPTTIDASMIGQQYGGRRGYRKLTITPTKAVL